MTAAAINLQGNHACALGAIAAGCDFYAGYPITPSSEIAERMAEELPQSGGVFIQMEDEIGSMAAALGASMGGSKAMTATSGPGFSLKQENIGYGMGAEIPCVIVNVMRGGPSTGMPTRPSQGDLMQARWGTHGDHPTIVIAPSSVEEIYRETARAFDLAERLRTPVIVLFDEALGHLVETVELGDEGSLKASERKWATGRPEDYLPYAAGADGVPAMARPGDGYRVHTTGLSHDEDGFPTQNPEVVDSQLQRIMAKIDNHRELIDAFEATECEDADVVIVALGTVARAGRSAVRKLRAKGVKAGLFRPITLWPFPENQFRDIAGGAANILVAEMNAGQLTFEMETIKADGQTVSAINRFDGGPIEPASIIAKAGELVGS